MPCRWLFAFAALRVCVCASVCVCACVLVFASWHVRHVAIAVTLCHGCPLAQFSRNVLSMLPPLVVQVLIAVSIVVVVVVVVAHVVIAVVVKRYNWYSALHLTRQHLYDCASVYLCMSTVCMCVCVSLISTWHMHTNSPTHSHTHTRIQIERRTHECRHCLVRLEGKAHLMTS